MTMSIESFEAICHALPYRNKGMFYSEVFFFLQACAAHGVDLIIESGVKNGMSTRLIASAWPGQLVSIDKDSGALDPVQGVDFLHGYSQDLIPMVLAESRGRRVAVLIDGPKGSAALALKDAIWEEPEVKLVAIHDLPLGAAPGSSRHSQLPEYRRRVGLRLDAIMKHHYRDKYPGGPGLAIWEKKQ
jgi:hypothetical protein